MKIKFENVLLNLQLGTKATLAAISALILVSIVFTALFFTFHKQSSINELRIRSFSLASNLAYNSYYAVIAKDLERLDILVTGVIREKDIEKAIIIDKNLNVLASTDTVELGRTLPFEFPDTLQGQAWLSSNTRSLFRTITPITIEKRETVSDESFLFLHMGKETKLKDQSSDESGKEIIGFVILEVSLVNLNKSISNNLWKAIIITLVIIAIGSILTTLTVHKIVHPLQMLANATKEIARGKFGRTIPITRNDEIGLLAASFNEMTMQLKKSRDDYEALNKELARKVAESTSELNAKYEELEKTLSSLKLKDLAKDDYLALISHEIRTPLNSIQIFSELMLRGPDKFEEKRADFLTNIIKNCERLTRLLNDVLDCLKIESGKMQFRYEDFNLVNLVNEVIASLAPNLGLKNIKCHHNFQENDVNIWSDKDKVFQVLTNVISNAIKFSSKGRDIVVSTKNFAEYVEINVKDYGKGIKKEDVSKVFDKFSQIDQTPRDSMSIGLGLSIAKSIVEHLGGKIWIKSQFGKGTTVFFKLAKNKKDILSDK